jgi:cytochrome c peroxidase
MRMNTYPLVTVLNFGLQSRSETDNHKHWIFQMTINTGDSLPDATLIKMGAEGPEEHTISDLTAGKKVVIFAVPGAYTPTCSSAHMPSFVKNADAIRAKGVDDIICVSVNDAFVMASWAADLGADTAGINSLGDADGSFTKAIGMDFTAPPVGLLGRSKRYAMIVENGTVTAMNEEEAPGVCDISGGENILDQL